jgi:hypothetical protein
VTACAAGAVHDRIADPQYAQRKNDQRQSGTRELHGLFRHFRPICRRTWSALHPRECCAGSSGDSLTPSPPTEKATGRGDLAGHSDGPGVSATSSGGVRQAAHLTP